MVTLNVQDLPEYKTPKVVNLLTETHCGDLCGRFSSLENLKRVTAYLLRFKNNTLNKGNRQDGLLTSGEISQAFITLLKSMQMQEFSDELSKLGKGKDIASTSKLISLSPFIDADGLLRVGGRISKSNVSYDQKHPVIISNNHSVARLIIINEHNEHIQNFYSGSQHTLYQLRLKY
ncbi:hypothetical protein JTB14_020381 [Gonioctena quinquepunctata]|nr:hypothetical protein JTB14_020381 [Gonioctena quinquepunctata]